MVFAAAFFVAALLPVQKRFRPFWKHIFRFGLVLCIGIVLYLGYFPVVKESVSRKASQNEEISDLFSVVLSSVSEVWFVSGQNRITKKHRDCQPLSVDDLCVLLVSICFFTGLVSVKSEMLPRKRIACISAHFRVCHSRR